MFCPNCGTKLADSMNFCPECGTKINVVAPKPAVQGNMVMLLSLGTCPKSTAAALLEAICGYSDDEALLIADSAPITVARGLSEAQARFLAQAFAEYGMEVTVYDGEGWRDWESNTTSVWDNAGSLVTGVAAALGLINLNNRISRDMMHRMDMPYRYSGTRPPVYRLNNVLRTVPRSHYAMRPPVRHAPPPPPPPVRHAAPPPTPPRPAPAARPAPTPPQRPATPGTPQRPPIPGQRPGGSGRSGGGRPGGVGRP